MLAVSVPRSFALERGFDHISIGDFKAKLTTEGGNRVLNLDFPVAYQLASASKGTISLIVQGSSKVMQEETSREIAKGAGKIELLANVRVPPELNSVEVFVLLYPEGAKKTQIVDSREIPFNKLGAVQGWLKSPHDAFWLVMIPFWMAFLVVLVLNIAGLWKICVKAGHAGWEALIPIWHALVWIRIAGKPDWWFFLLLIPGVNLIVWVVVNIGVARSFGRGTLFGWGLAFLPMVCVPILGFSKSVYDASPK
ncbi:MAG: DUF5684 domain-containing protein [Pseudomonadota bacterium]